MKELFERCLNASYIHTNEDGDYALEVDGDTLYLLFQWSHSHMDWVSNFDFPAKAYKNGTDTWRAHRGFLRVWKAMRDDIERKVDKILAEKKIQKIVCVGYSHGAAISLLATEDMVYLHGDKYTVNGYGFGVPRCVWGKLPEGVYARVMRFKAISHKQDIVSHMPPRVFGFRHLNKVVLTAGERLNCIDAHRPENYLKTLERRDKNGEY